VQGDGLESHHLTKQVVQGDGLGSHHLTKQVVQGDGLESHHLIKANIKPNKSLIALVETLGKNKIK